MRKSTSESPGRSRTAVAATRVPATVATVTMAAALTAVGSPTYGQAPTAAGSELRPLTVREAVEFQTFPTDAPIRVSPDGRRVAYTVQGPRRTGGTPSALATDTGTVRVRVRVADLETGATLEVTSDADSWSPAWSPDGSTLAFHSNRGGRPGLWVWSPDRGSRRVTDAVVWTAYLDRTPRWTPDGDRLVVKLLPEGRDLEEAVRRSDPASGTDAADRPGDRTRATARVFRSGADDAAGSGPPDWLPWQLGGDLAVVDAATGALHRVAVGRMPAWWEVSPDGATLAFTALHGIEDERAGFRLHVVPIGGGDVRTLPGTIRQAFGDAVSWSPDGERLAYVSHGGVFAVDAASAERRRVTDARGGWGGGGGPVWTRDGRSLLFADGDVWRVPVDGGAPSRVADDPTLEIHRVLAVASRNVAVTAEGDWTVAVGDPESGTSGFAHLDPRTGEITRRALEPGLFGVGLRLDVTDDGSTVVTSFSSTRQAPDLWLLDTALRRDRQVSALNPAFDRVALGTARLVEWEGAEGRTLDGTLLLPPGREAGDPAGPMIVEVYGGRSGASARHGFDRFRQLLATRGYAVLVPSVPLEVGAPLRGHVEAVVPGVDRVAELGLADPERVGVYGHSYGGYGVLALLAGTDRFAAGVASAAHGNMAGMFSRLAADGTSRTRWAESGQGRMGAPPWSDPATYVENSPLFFLDRVRAPLLLLHGAEDRNTPAYLAGELFTGLRRLGRTVVLARYEGEGHWWGTWSLPNQLDYWTRVVGWFDARLAPDR